jgi:hypothetical protein
MRSKPVLYVKRCLVPLFAARHDPQKVVRQWLLQCHGFVDRARRPRVPLQLLSKHLHCLDMDGTNNAFAPADPFWVGWVASGSPQL